MLKKMMRIFLMLMLIPTLSLLGTVSSGEPFFGVCGVAEATEISFDEMYSGASSRGVEISDTLRNNVGCTVSMVGFMAPATKNIDKSVYVLEIFLIHRTRSRCLERQATSVCIALRRRKFPTSHRYIYRDFYY